jgi:ABC-type spermidine/putrescine transport system permease subunit I
VIPLLTIWGWLLIGVALGRVLFVRVLGDEPRRGAVERTDSYNRLYTKENGWTGAFNRAVWAGVACVVAWPVALPLALMLAHTGSEKLRAKRQRLQAEVAQLEQEIGADRG